MNDVIKVSSEMFFFCEELGIEKLVDRLGNQKKSTFCRRSENVSFSVGSLQVYRIETIRIATLLLIGHFGC